MNDRARIVREALVVALYKDALAALDAREAKLEMAEDRVKALEKDLDASVSAHRGAA